MTKVIEHIDQVENAQEKTFAVIRAGISGVVPVPEPCTLITDDGNSYEITKDTHVIAFDKDGHVWPVTHKYMRDNYEVVGVGQEGWNMIKTQSLEVKDGRNTSKQKDTPVS